ncbi:hypothetical protein [Bdellovibrio sp. HCB274]|uniref:hypothetical protein n=1 Tax=Bdellovibrio sp. HCB274 TaxID=3394361 RepID=UPI0039B542E0
MKSYRKKIIITFAVIVLILTAALIGLRRYNDFILEVVNPSQGVAWNWCPLDVDTIHQLFDKKVTKDANDLVLLCNVVMEKDNLPEAKSIKFRPYLMARNKSATTTVLEANDDRDIFRVDGQMFKSRRLNAVLVQTGF